MPLRFENEFVVAAAIEPTWVVLVDLARVAQCLPGASIVASEQEGIFEGTMRVKVGPVTVDYRGVARIEELDEVARTAVIKVEGREQQGQGTASARIRNTLAESDDGTRVLVETELSVTGRPAQFGRGIMQDVASSMLEQFARCLSETIAREAVFVVESSDESSAAQVTSSLDLTAAVRGAVGRRVARVTGVTLLGGLLSRLRRVRKGGSRSDESRQER